VKNKILKILLAISILADVGGFIHYEHQLNTKQAQISKLQDNVKTKSDQIAKLDSVIKINNEKILEQDKVILENKKVIDSNTGTINELNRKAEQFKAERDKALAEKQAINFKKEKEGSGVGVSSPAQKQITVEATAYIAMCSEGCTGRTRTGVDVSNSIYYRGYRVIAVDTSVIPLNSLVKVETTHESFTAMAIDTGGGINGHEIDVLVSSESKARAFGRQQATLTILKEGK
jgi:3D (Asp-Asp-Asp) domain-containing protein